MERKTRAAIRSIGRSLSLAARPSTQPTDSGATVTNVEGGTAWVLLDGASEPTPVSMTIDCKPGDRVRVRVSSAGAHVSGNATAPPTDDAEALAAKVRAQLAKDAADTAQTTAESAQETADGALAAAESAQDTADGAASAAEATNQHFWHRDTDPDSDGAGTGAFVTDEEQDDFLSAIASGTAPTTARPLHNLLMNAEGILLRAATRIRAAFTPSGVAFYDGQGNQASNVNAAFGSDGFQVGRSGESHLTGDYHSLQLVNKEGTAYFYVSDLRDRTGTASVEDVFTADGSTRMFFLAVPANSTDYAVTVSDGSGGTVTKSHSMVSFSTAPSDGASIVVEYVTEDPGATAFTYGSRESTETVGLGSAVLGFGAYASDFAAHAEGYQTGAEGRYSHAEGIGSTASGASSHAEGGYTEATAQDSHAEGYQTHASGDAAHAEGLLTRASGTDSHAEGIGSQAKSTASHAQNYYTIAASSNQTAIGKYNVEDSNDLYAFIIGNGTASNLSNALTVDWSGNVELAGSVKPGNVTAGRAAITGANGEVTTSSVTSTELNRLAGITSNVQSQLDSKVNASSVEITTANGYIYVLFSVDDDNKLQVRANATTQAVRTKISGTWSSWRTI